MVSVEAPCVNLHEASAQSDLIRKSGVEASEPSAVALGAMLAICAQPVEITLTCRAETIYRSRGN